MEEHTLQRKAIIVCTSATLWLRRFITFGLACGLFSPLIRAQEPDFAWVSTFGTVLITNNPGFYSQEYNSKVNSLALDQDGNILLACSCNDPSPTYLGPNGTGFLPQGSFVAKVNPGGKILWTRSAGRNTSILGVASDTNGNIYISGLTNTTAGIPFTTGNPGVPAKHNLLLIKYDAHGNFLWSLQSRGTAQDAGTRMILDGSNNLYLTGFYSSSNFVLGCVTLTNVFSVNPYASCYPAEEFIAKIDPEGKVLWAKPIFGTTWESWLNPPCLDSSGNIILGGTFNRPLRLDNLMLTNRGADLSFNDVFVAKYDAAGGLLGAKDLALGQSLGAGFAPARVISDPAGDIYVAGVFNGASASFGDIILENHALGGPQQFLAKFTRNGKALWATGAVTVQGFWANNSAIYVDASGNICQLASCNSNSEADFGKIVLPPDRPDRKGPSNPTFYVIKRNCAGTVTWVADIHTKEGRYPQVDGRFIQADKRGNVYLAGTQNIRLEDLADGGTINKKECFLAKLPATQIPEGAHLLSW